MAKIMVIGAGGVGGYFGGRLAQAGNEVTFIARGEHRRIMEARGLKVKSTRGDFEINPVRVTDKIAETGTPDLVILGVKAWQIKETALQIKPVIASHTVVLPLQNGVMASEELQSVLGEHNVIGGLCRIFSKIESPGVINHYGIEPTIVFGELNHRLTDRMVALKDVFDKAGIASKITEDIHTELWKKLMIIASGGLLALTRAPYGAVREIPYTRELIKELLQEINDVSQKAGAKIEPSFTEQTLTLIDTYPFDSDTSLARDIWEGKPSEIEYQNGSVVKLGQKYGVKTPVNKFVYTCLLPMEYKARKILKSPEQNPTQK